MTVPLLRFPATILVLAAVAGCGRGPSVEVPPESPDPPRSPARVSVAAPGADSTAPISRDSADRCRWEAPVPRYHTRKEDWLRNWDEGSMRRGVPLRCVLRDGGPEVRVVVHGDDRIPMGVEVYSPPDARERTQSLVLDNDQPAGEGSELLVGEDLNDDGWTDLRVQTWSGTAGVTHDVFMWNPAHGRFEQDSVFPGGIEIYAIAGRPCVGTSYRSGISYGGGGEYCWARGGWHLVSSWTKEMKHGEHFYVRTTETLRDGRVLRMRVDTVPYRSR